MWVMRPVLLLKPLLRAELQGQWPQRLQHSLQWLGAALEFARLPQLVPARSAARRVNAARLAASEESRELPVGSRPREKLRDRQRTRPTRRLARALRLPQRALPVLVFRVPVPV